MTSSRDVPDATKVRALLEKYFDGPITDAQVALVESKVREIAGDAAKLRVEIHAFYANAGRYHGRMWREELESGPIAPDAIDLVPWFASTLDGFPPARGHCPAHLVGLWQSDGARWRLDANGEFSTTQSPFADRTTWCVRPRDVVGDLLLLGNPIGGLEQLTITRAAADELELRHVAKKLELRRRVVRTTREMSFAALLQPCASCGLRDATKLKYRGSGTNWFFMGPCVRCGVHRLVKFRATEDPLETKAPRYELGPGPSRWLSSEELLELLDLAPPIRDPKTVPGSEWANALEALDHARTCIHELLKLDARGPDPRLDRTWLEEERDRLAAVQQAYVAEMPRASAEQREAKEKATRR